MGTDDEEEKAEEVTEERAESIEEEPEAPRVSLELRIHDKEFHIHGSEKIIGNSLRTEHKPIPPAKLAMGKVDNKEPVVIKPMCKNCNFDCDNLKDKNTCLKDFNKSIIFVANPDEIITDPDNPSKKVTKKVAARKRYYKKIYGATNKGSDTEPSVTLLEDE